MPAGNAQGQLILRQGNPARITQVPFADPAQLTAGVESKRAKLKELKMVYSKGRAGTTVLLTGLSLGLAACADGVAYPYEDGYYYDEGLPFDGDDFDRRDDFRFHHHLHHHHGHLDHGDLVPHGIQYMGRPSGGFGHGGFGGDFGGGHR